MGSLKYIYFISHRWCLQNFLGSNFRLMTDCRLMGSQVNWIKFNIKYGHHEYPAECVKKIWFLKYKASCLKPKGTQILTVKIYFMLFLICFHSRHFHMLCMTEWTVTQTSLTTQSLPYGGAGLLHSNWLVRKSAPIQCVWEAHENAGISDEVAVWQEGL